MTIPQDIPYTIAAEKYKAEEFVGSAEATLQIKESDKVYGSIYGEYNHLHQRKHAKGEDKGATENNFDLEYGDYEDIGTPVPMKVNWLSRQKDRLASIRSNKCSYSCNNLLFVSKI